MLLSTGETWAATCADGVELAWSCPGFPGRGLSVTAMGLRYTSAAYRELGRLLREKREKAGKTETRLAHELGWSLVTISRMENGGRASSTTDVVQYLVVCGMYLAEMEQILEFTRMAERRQGCYLSDKRIGGSLQSLIFHESSADHAIMYEPQVIHGLLQTPAYARSLISAISPDITQERIAAARWYPDGAAADSVPAEACTVHHLSPRAGATTPCGRRQGHGRAVGAPCAHGCAGQCHRANRA
jgi:DNA-binding XRE family transcriptional regulator